MKRKNPLNDFEILTQIGLQSTRSARSAALNKDVSFTFAQAGRLMKHNPDGFTPVIRDMQNHDNVQPSELIYAKAKLANRKLPIQFTHPQPTLFTHP